MRLLELYNNTIKTAPYLAKKYSVPMCNVMVNGTYHYPAFTFYGNNACSSTCKQIYVVCERHTSDWFWVFHTGHITIPLYCEHILGSLNEYKISPLINQCLIDFMDRLIKNRHPDSHLYYDSKTLQFLHWEYLRLYICIKHKISFVTTVVPKEKMRSYNNHYGLITDSEINQIC